ncbi:hypothetical protein VCRA2123O444_280053 [Vibrio crassostreae]|uniref:hypothetical protein n=1 Tax=Vibrio crassostreae TaxID=246167 RepID=UPI001B3169D4|nr:hypothetical protein [Vibrio crassostreae]CAK1932796.1 hypothetical protein VCRA2113O416_250056 [Vibrio crassostreae]CAK1938841.1 hypothetical protein VCRA2117O428_260024 [Vibrio crassostreae]CAK1950694.1 hypothetical protein VCRA2119O430_270054 [Vibrio crassostreae]CAK1951518.1 hypothetical protein VCRA2114O422_280053 [Vibrio crassostreae]CAK1957930.1 hypothetical protein VCRA2119O431_280052 [Vibrio crassostreae]
MPKIDSEKLKKRLTWITPSDREQADWIRKYLKSHREPAPWFSPHELKSLASKEYVEAFVSAAYHAVDGDNVSYDRVEGVKSLCNKLKAAWTSKQRRKKNTNKTETAFTISNKARSQLEKLAKNQNCSFSQVVESLVLSSKEISALERNLAKALNSESDKKKSKISLFQSMLKKQNDLSNLEEQLLQLQKQNEELAKRLSALGNDNCALTKKVADYEHEIHDLRLEAEQLQAGLENNTSGANYHHSPKEDLSQNYPDLTQDKNSTDAVLLNSEQQGPMLQSAWGALKANSD